MKVTCNTVTVVTDATVELDGDEAQLLLRILDALDVEALSRLSGPAIALRADLLDALQRLTGGR